MKISNKYVQFKEGKVLIVVAGKQEAEFYFAHNGVIEKTSSFFIQRPKYSDKEGFFASRGGGKTFKSGSVLEYPKEKLKQLFDKIFKKEIRKRFPKDDFMEVFLFAPAYMKNQVKGDLPAFLRNKIRVFVDGDYVHKHPFDILEKITKELKSKLVVPDSEEAEKILEKSVKARRVIKGKPTRE